MTEQEPTQIFGTPVSNLTGATGSTALALRRKELSPAGLSGRER
jgi:hypothetical protein